MSFWFWRKREDGSSDLVGIDVSPSLVMVLMPLLGVAMAILLFQQPLLTGVVLLSPLALGFLLFLAAKISMIRRGKFLSFGSSGMSPPMRMMYRAGYILMALAAALIVLHWLAFRTFV